MRVRILTDGEITDAHAGEVREPARNTTRCSTAGFEIYEYEPTMMHVKAMVIDGVWSVIGSANFDNRSFELNDELTIGVADRELAAALTADFDRDLARTTKLELATWRSRSLLQKSRETFWAMFGEIF